MTNITTLFIKSQVFLKIYFSKFLTFINLSLTLHGKSNQFGSIQPNFSKTWYGRPDSNRDSALYEKVALSILSYGRCHISGSFSPDREIDPFVFGAYTVI